MTDDSQVPEDYKVWQWLLASLLIFLLIPALILMLIGISSSRLRPKLSAARVWVSSLTLWFLFIVCVGMIGSSIENSSQYPTASPSNSATRTISSTFLATRTSETKSAVKSTSLPQSTASSYQRGTNSEVQIAIDKNSAKMAATYQARQAVIPSIVSGPCRHETPETSAWFEKYFRDHTRIKVLVEILLDDINPEGSYYAYGSTTEVKEVVDQNAEIVRGVAEDISRSHPPDNVPIRVKHQKDNLSVAYDEFAEFMILNFNGDIQSLDMTGLERAFQKVLDAETHSHPIILRVANSDVNCDDLK